jgi:hypothetical protein
LRLRLNKQAEEQRRQKTTENNGRRTISSTALIYAGPCWLYYGFLQHLFFLRSAEEDARFGGDEIDISLRFINLP